MVSVYDSKETDFTHNGIVVLNDCIICNVIEENNGQFELELEYPLDERGKWEYLLEDNVIKADGQLFRIYHKTTTLTSRKINARHIFYDLLDNFIEDSTIIGTGSLNYLLSHTQFATPFTSISDISSSTQQSFVQKNAVEAIMGTDGAIATWGGEIVRDNFLVKILGARGLDRGVLISYGKNVQGIEETLDMDGLCTRMYPQGTVANGKIITLPEKYIDSQYIGNYSHPKVKSAVFDATQMPTVDVTTTEVTTAKTNYYNAQASNNAGITGALASTKVVSDASDSNNLIASEKTSINAEWLKILIERPINDTSAIQYFIGTWANYDSLDALKTAIPLGDTHIYKAIDNSKWYFWNGWDWKETLTITTQKIGYDTAYTALHDYILPLLASLTTTSAIVSSTFKTMFKNYYSARATLLNTVVQKTIDQIDIAQAKANLDNDVIVLRQLAVDYFITSKCDLPQATWKIDFLELSRTEEYKNYAVLETMYMCDTVTVKHSKLNINLKTKIVKTTKNVLTNRIEKIELGITKPTLAGTINDSIQNVKAEMVIAKSSLQSAIDNATLQINSALGGYVVKRNGELLIMDTDDIMTAVNVWRWDMGGLGFSSTGYNGSFGTAITADGSIVADFIATGVMNADLIRVGSILGGAVDFNLDEGSLTISHTDGSYTEISADGFDRHIAGVAYDYNYLNYTGTVNCSANQSTTVTVPSYFAGTAWHVVLMMIRVSAPVDHLGYNAGFSTYGASGTLNVNYPLRTFNFTPSCFFLNTDGTSWDNAGSMTIGYTVTA